MNDRGAAGAVDAGRVARLWLEGGDGAAVPAGHLVTRVCTHWDTVGPGAFRRHVNPEPRVQWRARFDDGADDVYSDDPDAPTLRVGHESVFLLHGRRLRVEWLDGAVAAAAWEQHGW